MLRLRDHNYSVVTTSHLLSSVPFDSPSVGRYPDHACAYARQLSCVVVRGRRGVGSAVRFSTPTRPKSGGFLFWMLKTHPQSKAAAGPGRESGGLLDHQ